MDNKVFKDINYGMYIVSSANDKKVGCVINTLTQLTSVDPTISICLNKNNYTNKVIQETKKLAISILSEKTNANTIAVFGFSSSKDVNKFVDIDYEEINNIPVVLDNICSYLICEVINIIDVGTHDLIIAKVIETKKISDNVPMTYNYYHQVIKGSAPKNAPTYINEENKNKWVCDVCGYVYDGDISDDFVCPVCGVDRSHFKKIT